MIDKLSNIFKNKAIDSYKIIEDRYLTLKTYLTMLIEENKKTNKIDIKDIERILKSLDDTIEIIEDIEVIDDENIEKKCEKQDK